MNRETKSNTLNWSIGFHAYFIVPWFLRCVPSVILFSLLFTVSVLFRSLNSANWRVFLSFVYYSRRANTNTMTALFLERCVASAFCSRQNDQLFALDSTSVINYYGDSSFREYCQYWCSAVKEKAINSWQWILSMRHVSK